MGDIVREYALQRMKDYSQYELQRDNNEERKEVEETEYKTKDKIIFTYVSHGKEEGGLSTRLMSDVEGVEVRK